MTETPYNLTPHEALAYLRQQLAKHKAETDRNQLAGVSPDDAFDTGYEACIYDLSHYTGPSPAEEYDNAVQKLNDMEKKK